MVKTSLDLICIEVQMLNYRAVEVSDRSYIRLSRNQMVELNWSVEFKILGTIKRCKKILIKSYFFESGKSFLSILDLMKSFN